MDVFSKLSTYFTGAPTEEETEEEKYNREIKHAKLMSLSADQRRVLLSELQKAITGLYQFISEKELKPTGATMESTDEAKMLILNDDLQVVSQVCDQIDKCCSHGLRRVEGEKDSFVKFFGLLKWTCARLEAMNQHRMATGCDEAGSQRISKQSCQLATSSLTPELSRDVRGFIACVRTANSLANVHLDEGKARGFIRQALNTHILQKCLKATVVPINEDLLISYYTEYALFRNEDDRNLFLSLLDGLNTLSFGFMVDDLRLDMCPDISPFSHPLPRPVAKPYTIAPPELIDPEDMIEGRVRLSTLDSNCDILKDKLVHHSQLKQEYDNSENGNPLSNVLKKAYSNAAIDDIATAVLRFLEIGYPEYEVFGSPLINVVCNPFLCGMARFDTFMGIPDVVEACICYLHRKLATPGLFQVHLSSEHVMDLRDAIEELGGFHKSMAIDPHEVVSILIQYLWELPEPIFTDERWEAFVACGEVEDPEQQIRNLTVLFNDLPWCYKPLLERLLHLFSRALSPEFSQRSGITVPTLALFLSPITLRPKRDFNYSDLDEASYRRFPIAGHTPVRHRLPIELYSEYPSQETERVANEARAARSARLEAEQNSKCLKILLTNHSQILTPFRSFLKARRIALESKVRRLESVRVRLETSIDLKNDNHIKLLKILWEGLLPISDDGGIGEILDNSGEDFDVKSLLASKRWKHSGFHTDDPMGAFRGGKLLSLQCMAFFVTEYPEKAKDMMKRNAVAGGNRYPFPVACVNVMRMMVTLLMLDKAPATPSKLILHSESGVDSILELQVSERVSRTPFWKLFDDENAFEKLQAMAFMILDLHWTKSGATQMGFNPVLDSTRRQMGWLLEQAPKTMEEIWKLWMQVREKNVQKSNYVSVNDRISENEESIREEKLEQKLKQIQIQEKKRIVEQQKFLENQKLVDAEKNLDIKFEEPAVEHDDGIISLDVPVAP